MALQLGNEKTWLAELTGRHPSAAMASCAPGVGRTTRESGRGVGEDELALEVLEHR